MESLTSYDLAYKFINQTHKNVFLTGKAGTGKTTFLHKITQETHKKTMIIAPTGIAAINAGGVTIHSLFQLPFGSFIPNESFINTENNFKLYTKKDLFKNFRIHAKKRALINSLELLVIDEVSMLRADLLDAIDCVLKTLRKKQHLPFGGVQVLFIGDLLQLPPVVNDIEWNVLKNYYNSAFFFDAKVLQGNLPVYIELDKIYRQKDEKFVSLLNNFRNNIGINNLKYAAAYTPWVYATYPRDVEFTSFKGNVTPSSGGGAIDLGTVAGGQQRSFRFAHHCGAETVQSGGQLVQGERKTPAQVQRGGLVIDA